MAATRSPHLLIPFAGRGSPSCRAALATLRLPNLEALSDLLRFDAADKDTQDEGSFSPPHERALAQAIGMPPQPDGCIPLASVEAHRSGLAARESNAAWAFVTLCHWQVGIDDAVLGDPADLDIDADESAALFAVARPFFEEDGIALHAGATPGRWLACAKIFEGLPTASIDRAVGYPISQWSPLTDAARPLRRLQNEMQMLLYNQRVNDERAARGAAPINSFWLSGTGALPEAIAAGGSPDDPGHFLPWMPDPDIDDSLRWAALRDDGPAWAAAWQALDAGAIADLLARARRGDIVTLTLCGDRSAQTCKLQQPRRTLWTRKLFGRKPTAASLLDPL